MRSVLIDKTGAPVDSTNPLPVSVSGVAIEGGNATPVVVSGTNVDIRDLVSTQDSVKIEPGTGDIKVSLDGETVLLNNAVDLKVTLDGETVLIDNAADLKVTLDSEKVSVEGGNSSPVVVSATDLDIRNLTATDIVTIAQGASDLKVTLDSETVLLNNTSDIKITLDSEQVAVKPGTPSTPLSAVIANGQSVSGEIDLGGNSLLAVEMPAAFSGTVLTFQAARGTGGTFSNVYDDVGLEVSVAVAASRMVGIDIAALKLAPFRFIKIRSGTSASPTAEGGERTLYLVTK